MICPICEEDTEEQGSYIVARGYCRKCKNAKKWIEMLTNLNAKEICRFLSKHGSMGEEDDDCG